MESSNFGECCEICGKPLTEGKVEILFGNVHSACLWQENDERLADIAGIPEAMRD